MLTRAYIAQRIGFAPYLGLYFRSLGVVTAGALEGGITLAADDPAADTVGRLRFAGNWTKATTTPLERPRDLAGKATLTEEERAARAAALAEAASRPPRPGAYNSFWTEPGKSSARTSLIVDPPDGKLPALTPETRSGRTDATEAVQRRPPASVPKS